MKQNSPQLLFHIRFGLEEKKIQVTEKTKQRIQF